MVVRNGELRWPGTRLSQGKMCVGSNSNPLFLWVGGWGALNVNQAAASSRVTLGPHGVHDLICITPGYHLTNANEVCIEELDKDCSA